MANLLTVVEGGASKAPVGHNAAEAAQEALDAYVEETRVSVVDDLRPAFDAQAAHVECAFKSLREIARRGAA